MAVAHPGSTNSGMHSNVVAHSDLFDAFVRDFHRSHTEKHSLSTDTQFYGGTAVEPITGAPSSGLWTDQTIGAAREQALAQRDVSAFVRESLAAPGLRPATRLPRPLVEIVVTDRWEGVVTRLDRRGGLFEAQFVAVGRTHPKLAAEFLIEEVDEDDRELVRPGALFYATAGRLRVSKRRWQPTSEIRFRRLPPLRREELDDALEYGRKMRHKLGLDD